MMRLSLKSRILGAMVLLTSVVVLGLTAAVYLNARATRLTALDESLRQRAAALAAAIEHDDGVWEFNVSQPDHPAVVDTAVGYSVVDPVTGATLWTGGDLDPTPGRRFVNRRLAVHTERAGPPREVDITIAEDTGEITESLTELLKAMLGFGGLAVALSVGFGWVLAGSVVSAARYEQMRAAFERQRRFTASASHELRTPVSIIRSTAEVALRRERSLPDYRDALSTIATASERIQRLIEGLLWLARADLDELRASFTSVDLSSCVRAAVSDLTSDAESASVMLRMEGASHASVRGNAEQLQMLASNLIRNAVQHSGPGTTVRVEVATSDRTATLTVEDQGEGIEDEHLGLLFEPFYRADRARSRARGGLGLGLSIVRAVADAHGATIRVSSTPGKGSVFWVSMPRI